MALVGLEAMIDRAVTALSGGQRQRVAVARAVVFAPQIVLMDEPLSALDKNLREQMQVEIRHLHEAIGATMVYVTHDQREALTMSDRIAVIDHGRLVQCDTPAALYERPLTAFVAGFIGETTLLPLDASAGGVPALEPGIPLRTASAMPQASRLLLVLRSERVLLPAECEPQANRLNVTLREVLYQGDSLLLLTEAAGGVRLPIRRSLRGGFGEAVPEIGTCLRIGIDPANTIVVPA